MSLDERIRNAKPNYINVDKDLFIAGVFDGVKDESKEKRPMRLKAVVGFVVLPLAVLSAVGFADKAYHVEKTSTVTAVTGTVPTQVKKSGIQKEPAFGTNFGPFIQAKHEISLPKDQIAYSHSQITSKTRELIELGVPFIREDSITKDNIEYPNVKIPYQMDFVVAKHSIPLPESEIARSYKQETPETKEILIPGQPPLIRYNLVTDDNNAHFYSN